MATRFYLPATGTAPVAITPSTLWEVTTTYGTLPTVLVKSNTALTNGTARAKTATATVQDRLDRVYVSPPLAAQTISNAGTFSAVLRVIGSAASNDSWMNIILRVMSNDGTTERGVLYSGTAAGALSATAGAENQEIGTTLITRIKNAITLTNSVSVQNGDRIVIEIGFRQSTNNTNTVTYNYGDPSATADLALTAGTATASVPWVELSQDLALQPISDFTDNFSTLASSWSTYGTSGNVTSTSGQLQVVGSTTFSGRVTNVPRTLVGSSAVVESVQQLNSGAGGTYTYFNLYRDSSNKLQFDVRGAGLLTARRTIAGTETQLASTTYNNTTHRWRRIREDSGTIYWDYSADGQTWTNFTSATVASTFAVTSMIAELGCGFTGTETGTAIWDNFNLAPAGTTYQGAVTLDIGSGLSSDGIRSTSGAISLSSSATLSTSAEQTHQAATTLTTTASLSAGAALEAQGATSLTATPALAVNGVRITSGAAALTSTPSLSATGAVSVPGAANLAASVSLSTFAALPSGGVVLAHTSLLSVSGVRTTTGLTTLPIVGALSVSGVRLTTGAVVLPANSALSTAAQLQLFSSINLAVSSSLTALATVTAGTGFGSAPFGSTPFGADAVPLTLSAVSSLTVGGSQVLVAATSLVAAGSLSVSALRTTVGSVSLSSIPTLTTAITVRITQGVVTLSTLSTLTLGGTRITSGALSLPATAVLVANGLSGNSASANLASSHSLVVNGVLTKLGVAQLTVLSSLSAPSAQLIGFSAVEFVVAVDLLVGAGPVIKIGAVTLLASTSINADIVSSATGALSLIATALLQYVEVFPFVTFSTETVGWFSNGVYVTPPSQRREVGTGWTTDGTHTASTWS